MPEIRFSPVIETTNYTIACIRLFLRFYPDAPQSKLLRYDWMKQIQINMSQNLIFEKILIYTIDPRIFGAILLRTIFGINETKFNNLTKHYDTDESEKLNTILSDIAMNMYLASFKRDESIEFMKLYLISQLLFNPDKYEKCQAVHADFNLAATLSQVQKHDYLRYRFDSHLPVSHFRTLLNNENTGNFGVSSTNVYSRLPKIIHTHLLALQRIDFSACQNPLLKQNIHALFQTSD